MITPENTLAAVSLLLMLVGALALATVVTREALGVWNRFHPKTAGLGLILFTIGFAAIYVQAMP